MCETIELDGIVGVHVSRNREADLVGDDHLCAVHHLVLLDEPISRSYSQFHHWISEVGDILAVVWHLVVEAESI